MVTNSPVLTQSLPQRPADVQIVSTDENQVFLALQEWYQTDMYNLYQSDPQGVYYSIVLENVRSTKQPEENVLIDILEVRGIKGVFLANQKIDGKVMTLITYNKGRDWEPLAPPTTEMNGKPVSCKQPDCHLHLHLRWADNPYVSGTVHTKDSAPGLIMGAGNLGSQLVEYKEEMYITSDCGKTWRQDVQIVSTDENQVFLALQEWYQTDMYNLYQSDPQGVYYSIVLENVRSTKQPEENVLIDILEVRGIKGVFLANQKIDGKVMTLITYNKGRDWEPLAPPTTEMNGKPVSCKQPDCHLHLHLRWADNPYVSGTVHTKDSAPGLIMGAGNLGSQLVEYKEEMYITSDCGKTWRQVFEEEHHILYLDHGGVIVAIKDTSIPLKILKFSTDEGRTWSIHNFTSTSVFVDGLLSEPGDETLVMTVFGHISYRSDWELVKVDFRQSFPRQCTEADYDSWKLTDLQGEKCIMGQERMYRRRKESSFCIKGKSYTSALTAKPCQCTEKDFACDYGFERAPSLRLEGDRCYPDFWHDPDAPPENCHLGHSYKSSTGYRKVITNVCEGGLNKEQSAKQHSCPLLPPRGLQLGIKGQMLAVAPGDDITFIVHQEQGDTTSTRYQVDLIDGVRAIYENLTVTDEPIQHRYEKPGVYRVNVKAENSAGHDQATLYIQVTGSQMIRDLYLTDSAFMMNSEELRLKFS
ncbi:VPS10 domain-containing receptor SorCS2-like [Sinocyclocheilus rhinocerous]|uniref:VPS10 domain-containing receptor SorCS2-like n=1 Tax=Sinocyclocheilus rhinocerous TaxID=307959 RepID=UPI0007BAC1FB|nr:PREDICTED: VPS10 domain-containing receptor SorCS2-like [Sinocyclocheilus rhinocerous]